MQTKSNLCRGSYGPHLFAELCKTGDQTATLADLIRAMEKDTNASIDRMDANISRSMKRSEELARRWSRM